MTLSKFLVEKKAREIIREEIESMCSLRRWEMGRSKERRGKDREQDGAAGTICVSDQKQATLHTDSTILHPFSSLSLTKKRSLFTAIVSVGRDSRQST